MGGGGGNTETKTVNQTVKRGTIQNSNHLHNGFSIVIKANSKKGNNSINVLQNSPKR